MNWTCPVWSPLPTPSSLVAKRTLTPRAPSHENRSHAFAYSSGLLLLVTIRYADCLWDIWLTEHIVEPLEARVARARLVAAGTGEITASFNAVKNEGCRICYYGLGVLGTDGPITAGLQLDLSIIMNSTITSSPDIGFTTAASSLKRLWVFCRSTPRGVRDCKRPYGR
jgi:hypothetical protein